MTMTVQDIRSEFLGFFKDKGHTIVPSSSLVPTNDPTLMFTAAGMVQFKNVFTGIEKRPYTRATTAQKCVRAGGKHNDLDNVGYTARHHTFFEMMGNFSFGDYFKEDAIAFAWELVTKNLDLSPEKLLVTVHSSDEEAAGIWRKVTGFSDSKIIRIDSDDNFWSAGDTGPCGPCTEIFFDHGDKIPGGPPGSPDADGDRFIEIWNNVFMQYDQIAPGNRINLPKPSIDTGMGLERVSAILQGKHNNYDIDIFAAIIEHAASLTGTDPHGAQVASLRVIADHLRATAFLLTDGVMPSNEGRGYVLRRIMRRAMRHAHLLGAKEPIIYKLVPTLVAKMADAYPELKRSESLVVETLKNEETRFKRMLENGIKLLDEETAKVGSGKKFPGETAFKLYDTYGFPLDLTQDALRSKKIEVDTDAFNAAMETQREKARKSWKGSGDAATDKIWFEVLEQSGPTEFLGYTTKTAEGKILALVKDGKRVSSAGQGDEITIVVNQTPFYAESGGQVGDQGIFETAEGAKIAIEDTRKLAGKLWAHVGKVTGEKISEGDSVVMNVDETNRAHIESNHSVTHLLHEALRLTLGDHIAQKGSRQDAGRTRFDVSQPVPITADQLRVIEDQVNEQIHANTEVVTRVLPLDEAMESGARALFGEKYDDEVRVVSMGTNRPGQNIPYSVELCGGTHVKRTGDIGQFKIVSEGAVSSGVRRLEALTGDRVTDYLANQKQVLQGKVDALKAEIATLRDELKGLGKEDSVVPKDNEDDLAAHKKSLQKTISDLRRRNATESIDEGSVKTIGTVKFTSRVLPGFPAKDLKPMVDDLKRTLGSGVVTLIATDDGRASIVVGVTADLTAKYSAVDLVRVGAEAMGGKGGGGRPDMAQAGGPNGDAANDAVSAIEKVLAS